jgi:DNA-directed DNA polymerase III PolC
MVGSWKSNMSFIQQFQKYTIPVLTNGVKIPKFIIPPECFNKYNIPNDISDYDFLVHLCKSGFHKKNITPKLPNYKEYTDRLKRELDLFKELGFCGYALITWDIIRFCRENNIGTGYARGSAAGSLVLYLIDVVNHVDPIKHNLYFERFISRARAKFNTIDGVRYYDGSLLFDVDLDVDFKRRGEVMSYLEKKYSSQTAKLVTISTLSSKILIKEIVKGYLNKKEDLANEISNYIPKEYGRVFKIDEAIKQSEDFANFASNYPEAIKIAKKLHGLYLHYGVHASAFVISADKIDNLFPLQLTKNKELVTGYSMEDTLNLACKVDLLGLRSATLVQNVCQMININPEDINVNDEIIYKNLQNLDCPHGLFQIEADTNYHVLRKIKPRHLEDLSAIVAIARPGALQFVDSYAKYVKTGNHQSIHPFFDDVFAESGGLCLYQEQMMKAANKIGFTLDESEILRRIVGKKKLEEVKEWRLKIENKVKENDLPKEVGDILWKILEDSASYSFNKSHSVSYATMCAATAYLKFKHPKEFFVTLLNLTKDEQDPITEVSKIYKELQHFGIKLLPPHILLSSNDFTIEGDNIRVGLNSIKSISDKSLEQLKQFQNKYSNKFDIFRAANSAKLNLSVVSSLILAGSLDDMLTETRAKTYYEYILWNLLTDKEKNWASKIGEQYKFNLIDIIILLNEKITDEKGKSIIKDSRRITIRKNILPYTEIYNFNKRNEELSNWYFESVLLGFSYSTDLYTIYNKHVENLSPISEIIGEMDGIDVKFVGEVIDSKIGVSKAKKTPYFNMYVKDACSTLKVMLFNYGDNRNIDICKNNNGRLPKAGDLVIIDGTKKDGDTVFAEVVGIQNIGIFTKISQLPKKEISSDLT